MFFRGDAEEQRFAEEQRERRTAGRRRREEFRQDVEAAVASGIRANGKINLRTEVLDRMMDQKEFEEGLHLLEEAMESFRRTLRPTLTARRWGACRRPRSISTCQCRP